MFGFFLVLQLFLLGADAHSMLSVPTARAPKAAGIFDGNPLALIRPDGFHPKPGVELSVGTDNFRFVEDDFACRGGTRRSSPTHTLTAGQNFQFEFTTWALHPGDFALYVSYDTDDEVKDINKKWHLIHKATEFLCCKCNDPASNCPCVVGALDLNGVDVCSYEPGPVSYPVQRKINVRMPDWLPAGEKVILRYESYANHLREPVPGHPSGGNQVEFYANCADVTVVGGAQSVPVSQLSSVNLVRAQHLPQINTDYPLQYDRMNNALNNVGSFPGDVFPEVACVDQCLQLPTTAAPAQDPSASTGGAPGTTGAPGDNTGARGNISAASQMTAAYAVPFLLALVGVLSAL